MPPSVNPCTSSRQQDKDPSLAASHVIARTISVSLQHAAMAHATRVSYLLCKAILFRIASGADDVLLVSFFILKFSL